MYIYERPNWPQFHWDSKYISNYLVSISHAQGFLLGEMEAIGFHWKQEAYVNTVTQDVIKSSEIEGEILELSLVRSSIARHLGIETGAISSAERHVDGIVEMMLDATQGYDQPLTKERLFNWHGALFPLGRSGLKKIKVAAWRDSVMQVVSGSMANETVHYEAPPPQVVDDEMTRFLEWFNDNTTCTPLLKAGIAHLWFLSVHPFDDGNGRIARAISDMLLARSENSAQRFYSLSAQIQRERKAYYDILEQTQKGDLEISAWLKWFFDCLARAIVVAKSSVAMVFQKARFWAAHEEVAFNARQRKIINLLLDEFRGNLTSSKWAKITKCSQDTASRDISDLINKGILTRSSEGGRSTSYILNFNSH